MQSATKRLILPLFMTLLTAALLADWQPAAAQANHPDQIPDRLIVEYTDQTAEHERGHARGLPDQAVEAAGRSNRIDVVTVAPGRSEERRKELAGLPFVRSVHYDVRTRAAFVPSDALYSDGSQYAPQLMQADAAWDLATGENVIIAVVDSGVDGSHPDLVDRLMPGWNFYAGNADTSDGCGHGTHLAGTAAASFNNGIGIAGIAPRARIMPVKVLSDSCGGSYSRLIQGITYAADSGARVIVVASGGGLEFPALQSALVYARAQGSIVVAAAGNSGTNAPFYPASYPESYTVAATDAADGLYVSSTYGTQIDVAAPGVEILSTYLPASGIEYVKMSGTSAAAPQVAGVAALLLSAQPSLSVDALESVISATAEDRGAAGWDERYGHGRVNALQAVQAVQTATPTPLHVGDLEGDSRVERKKWIAYVAVTIHDAAGLPVQGASVNGAWSEGRNGMTSCVTDSRGICLLSNADLNAGKVSAVTFTVTGVSHPERVYDAAANRDADGDSNGTLIVVAN